jgi:ubiquinol-cytochrome c reductase cytochrome c subunit
MGAKASYVFATLSAGLVLGGLAWAQGTPKTPPAGDATRGQQLFLSVGCYECHGTVGQGGAGPRLAPDPLPADAIAQYIRHPGDVMPPYVQSVLGDKDVADIRAYLASLPASPPAKDIRLLSQ